MLPTPSTSHVDTSRIYEPSEDSYLLLDTLSSAPEISFLTQRFCQERGAIHKDGFDPAPIILEIGTGSGVILAFVIANSKIIFGRDDIIPLGTDVNEIACSATIETIFEACPASNNSEDAAASEPLLMAASLASTICADLASALRFGVADVLIFNPPYVPTSYVPDLQLDSSAEITPGAGRRMASEDPYEQDSRFLSLSYAGGVDGMEVTNRLLEQLPSILSGRGVAYILLCHQNQPGIVMRRIEQWGNEWAVHEVGKSGRQAGWEKLSVIRVWRTESPG